MKRLTVLLVFLLCFVSLAWAAKVVTASLAAQNTYSDVVYLKGYFNFSLTGTWTATVWVQRSFDNGSTWVDVKSYTANVQDVGYEPEANVCYRFGVKTGGYTTGTVVGRISQ